MKKRSLMLVVLLLALSALLAACGGTAASPTAVVSQPTADVAEPTEMPAEEPTEAPAEEPTEAPAEEPTEAPAEEPTAEATEEPVEGGLLIWADEARAYLDRLHAMGGPFAALVLGLRTLVLMNFYQHPQVLAALEIDWAGRAVALTQRRAALLEGTAR